jgi:hypothetical protein
LFFVFSFFAFRIILIFSLLFAPLIVIWLAITDVPVKCKTGLSNFFFSIIMFQTILTYGRDEGRAPRRVLPLSNRQGKPHSSNSVSIPETHRSAVEYAS